MPSTLVSICNFLIFLSLTTDFLFAGKEKLYPRAILRILFAVPLLALTHFLFAQKPSSELIPILLCTEFIGALCLIHLACLFAENRALTILRNKREISVLLIAILVFFINSFFYISPGINVGFDKITLRSYTLIYFHSLLLLLGMLLILRSLEKFWQGLQAAQQREYKIFIIGCAAIAGLFIWLTSYRITYLTIHAKHFFLTSSLLTLFWLMTCYAVARYKLFKRKIFVSRKIVYSVIAPAIFTSYVLTLGIISLLMRTCGWPLSFVLQWFLIIFGLLILIVFTLSEKASQTVKYFISTHFYVNKYEYRDEWLAFSNSLQGTLSESGVIYSLCNVLLDTLYSEKLMVWLNDGTCNCKLVFPAGNPSDPDFNFISDPSLCSYLKRHKFFYLKGNKKEKEWRELAEQGKTFFENYDIVLLFPLAIGNQQLGIIGLVPESTGGTYGPDDFDLLHAMGTQAASAILAARMAGELAKSREQTAWHKLSAFVLHDIKNAAAMLSLVQGNAPAHINNPEFQQDMLQTIEDALKRMHKVQTRLHSLKGKIRPDWQEIDLGSLIKTFTSNFARKIPGLIIKTLCPRQVILMSDPHLVERILENLLLNSVESVENEISVEITVTALADKKTVISITDNGPGIQSDLLPEALFEPFRTNKPKGSGIGLWQVHQLAANLGGSITAENIKDSGARFTLTLPNRKQFSGEISV